MKHTTKLPILIGILSIIAIFLMAFNCDKPKPGGDKKVNALTITKTADSLGKGATNTAGAKWIKKDGADSTGKTDASLIFAKKPTGDDKKFKIVVSSSSKSTAFTYAVAKVVGQGAKKDDITFVPKTGEVTIKNGKQGLYHISITQAAKGDYKKGATSVYLAVTPVLLVPIPPVEADLKTLSNKVSSESLPTSTAAFTAANAKTKSNAKVVITDSSNTGGKKFSVKAKAVDTLNLPPESVLVKPGRFVFAHAKKSGFPGSFISSDSPVSATGLVTLDSTAGSKEGTITVSGTVGTPKNGGNPIYAISEVDFYELKWE